ncbi:MAG: TlpA family protein disulfide reductase [Candidatus Eisenbacteria bacterium]|nr:TlpA family protein disulfide reductase [Candidatus Eisenbacteria bacterium]
MSRLVLAIVVLVVVVGLGAGWQLLTPTAASRDQAPAFTVRTLDGRTQRLSDLRGRPVMLDFWATWCAPCRASLPNLDAMQRRYGTRGLMVLGLSVDDDGPVAVRRFADRLGVRFPIAMAEEKVLDDYGPIRTIPTTILINRRGQVVRRVVGYIDEETLDGYVKEIL